MTRSLTSYHPSAPALSKVDQEALTDLYIRGTPPNTLRAYERDLFTITAWKLAAFAEPLVWPEREDVALRFILDHSRGLNEVPGGDPARVVAEHLISLGLHKSLACPAPSRPPSSARLEPRPAGRRRASAVRNCWADAA